MSAYFTIKNTKKMLGKRVNVVNTLLQICNKDTLVTSIGYVQRSSRSMYGLFLQIQNPHIYTTRVIRYFLNLAVVTSYSSLVQSSQCN